MINTQDHALLKINDATVSRDGKRILDSVSLEIAEGQHTAIIGPNGSGKSTLIKVITRQHYPLAHRDGTPAITIFGRDRWDVFELRSLMGIVSSDVQQWLITEDSLPCFEVVVSGFFASHGLFRNHTVTEEMQDKAHQMLTLVGASHLADRAMETLSTGEARRVLIARALVSDPRALLLDEPTTGLDLVAMRRFVETVRGIAHHGKTIILVTHHIDEIMPEIDRVILMRDGKVFLDGPKEQILTSENLSAMFGARVSVRQNSGYYFAEAEIGLA